MRLRLTHRLFALISAVVLIAAALSLSAGPTRAGATDPAWQTRLNAVRSMSLLGRVTASSTWGSGCWNHSRYMTQNNVMTHSESSSNRWYTSSGAAAASHSNLAMSSPSGALGTGTRAIDMWAVGPFHGLGILNPRLKTVGWGLYRTSGKADSAALNIRSGVSSTVSATYPIKWPGPGSTTPFLRYSGGEAPDPRSMSGYALPCGAPVIVQFAKAPSITAYSIRCNGQVLSCRLVTPTTYRNSNASQQQTGRLILSQSNAVYILPRYAFVSGRTYTVSLVNSGTRYTWSFKAGTAISAATSH